MEVTQKHLDAARAAGACHLVPEGTPVWELSQGELIWCENHGVIGPDDLPVADLRGRVPAWALSGDGYCAGYGYCAVYGYGYGDGYGDGDGYGYCAVYGYGYGYGYGDGDGYGSGSREDVCD